MTLLKILLKFIATKAGMVLVGNALLIGIPLSVVANKLSTPANITGWLSEADTYQTLLDESTRLVELSSSGEVTTVGAQLEANPHIDSDAILQVVTNAINADTLQSQTEAAIQDTYRWLNGDQARPEFVVSIAPEKATLATALKRELKKQLADAPLCTANQTATSIITAHCRPPGVSLDSSVNAYVDSLLSEKGFLGDAAFDARDLAIDEEARETIPRTFQQLQQAPLYTVLAFVGGAALVLIFSGKDRYKRVRLISWNVAFTGFITAAASYATTRIDHLPDILSGFDAEQPTAQAQAARNVVEPFFLLALHDIARAIMVVSLLCVVFGVAALILYRRPTKTLIAEHS